MSFANIDQYPFLLKNTILIRNAYEAIDKKRVIMRKNSKHNQLQKNSSKYQIQSKFELANLSKSSSGLYQYMLYYLLLNKSGYTP